MTETADKIDRNTVTGTAPDAQAQYELIRRISANARETVAFLKHAPVCLKEGELIGGFTSFSAEVAAMQAATLGTGSAIKQQDPLGVYKETSWNLDDNFHYPMGTAFLKYGFDGVAEKARATLRSGRALPPADRATLRAVHDVYRQMAIFAGQHYPQLAAGAPETFLDAVRMFYLCWRVRCVLGNATIGRLDQYLYPFYRRDVDRGILGEAEATEILKALWRKINECGSGDTLINVMTGGSGPNGEDETNELSYLMLWASLETAMTEPHINARVHKGTPEAFLKLISEVHLLGFGQCTVYNDEVVIPALIKAGIPAEAAANYTNDGCTEIVIDRGGAIYFERVDAVKCVELTLNNGKEAVLPGRPECRYWTINSEPVEWSTANIIGFESGDIRNAAGFEQVLEAFRRQYTYQVREKCKVLHVAAIKTKREGSAPAFLNGTFEKVLETGTDFVRDTSALDTNMLFSGSIPTAADSLAAIKYAVFERRLCTLDTLLDALATNFDPEKYEGLRKVLEAAPKFGNDDDYVDLIAAEIARWFIDECAAYTNETGFRIWPALLGFMFVQESVYTGATPDGRRWKDPIGEHYSPAPGRAKKGPTAAIASAKKGPLAEAFGVAPIHISLSRSMAPKNEAGRKLLNELLLGALESGLQFINIACYSREEMEDARIHPERHGDLIVRVWGYCARFVDLSPEMQEHVMARALE
ncbi:MAG: hypothetical protein IJM24_03505 [Clostridia bacterium]|nr:hypothetical protein [Clostridia bacterium]